MRVVTLKTVKHGGQFHPPGTELDIEDPGVVKRLVEGGAVHHHGRGHRAEAAPAAGDDPAAEKKLQQVQGELRTAKGDLKKAEQDLANAKKQIEALAAENAALKAAAEKGGTTDVQA